MDEEVHRTKYGSV